ncbi:MBL fold metallo-hydrolase [Motilimonas cestriensis]|uniref:MBL fold metallo-hydrolase n=1 Tax=Motilimonas cestriensis TaxID=2742685 RepID=UPI003DA32A7E
MSIGLKIKLFEGGHCVHPGFVVKPGSGLKPRAFPAAVALIEHPSQGYLLFDTGYHENFFTVTRTFPERFYAWTTPCKLKHGDGIIEQLQLAGIAPLQINHLVLSHFHADHIAAVSEFNSAQIHCTQQGLNSIQQSGRINGVRKGYLKKLLPAEITKQLCIHTKFPLAFDQVINGRGASEGPAIELACADLFNDQSLYLVALPGHAAGQIGLLCQLTNRWVFLLADACWLIDSLADEIDQHWLANFLCDDVAQYQATLAQLRHCYRRYQHLIDFVPSHCSTTINALKAKGWMQ